MRLHRWDGRSRLVLRSHWLCSLHHGHQLWWSVAADGQEGPRRVGTRTTAWVLLFEEFSFGEMGRGMSLLIIQGFKITTTTDMSYLFSAWSLLSCSSRLQLALPQLFKRQILN